MTTIRLLNCKSTHPVPCGNPFNVCARDLVIVPGVPTVVRTGVVVDMEDRMELRGKSIKFGIDVVSVFLSDKEICLLVVGEGEIKEDECFASIDVYNVKCESVRFFYVKPEGRMICGESKEVK